MGFKTEPKYKLVKEITGKINWITSKGKKTKLPYKIEIITDYKGE